MISELSLSVLKTKLEDLFPSDICSHVSPLPMEG